MVLPSTTGQLSDQFERFSPIIICIGKIELQVSGRLTQATFELRIDGSFPPQLETAYPTDF